MRARVRRLLESHWHAAGYTMPNRRTYPWQWLWDSCFHSIIWAELGDERALIELDRLFGYQTRGGFVPHMSYHSDPNASVAFWGRAGASTITQPPMYGHTIAELSRRKMVPADDLLDRAERGISYLLRRRRRSAAGLIELCHPWESGCDDSARWDGALVGAWQAERWRRHKHDLLGGITVDDEGGAVANDRFAVASIGFNALVAFNALELDSVVDSPPLRTAAIELGQSIASRWDDALRTWTDDGAFSQTSGRVRTADAHFALLVDDEPSHAHAAAVDLVDPAAFGGRFGPGGVHRDEPSRDPLTYWRGPAWPQMSYLLWVALKRRNRPVEAASVAASTTRGAVESGFAEYWHPDTGQGAGAIPQSWTALVAVIDAETA